MPDARITSDPVVRKNVAKNLKTMRRFFGYSQLKLSDLTGISTGTIANNEVKGNPYVKTLKNYSDLYGVPYDDFFLPPAEFKKKRTIVYQKVLSMHNSGFYATLETLSMELGAIGAHYHLEFDETLALARVEVKVIAHSKMDTKVQKILADFERS